MKPVYEVVSGQILLSHRARFFELHSQVLLPIMREHGITPILLLTTELGRFSRFLDVYRYDDLADYERRTDALTTDHRMPAYYAAVGECVWGGINVEIMTDLPYSAQWIGE